jgi:hypothetical protein
MHSLGNGISLFPTRVPVAAPESASAPCSGRITTSLGFTASLPPFLDKLGATFELISPGLTITEASNSLASIPGKEFSSPISPSSIDLDVTSS